ncbi:hypothetical protein A2U01_0024987, partial [Trifolium medium]|nr:hypothetical protein [Trifolium medium]
MRVRGGRLRKGEENRRLVRPENRRL